MNNKTSDKNVANIEDDVNELKSIMNLRTESGFAYSQKNTLKLQKSIRNVLAEREQDKKRIQELEEYISIAPNLDEMTATKYINIQREAYIRGKAEEQQRAEQIIYENYIPKQVVIDELNRHKLAYEEFNKMYNNTYYEDDEKRARDFYMIVTEDRIVQVLTKLLGGEK